MNAFAKKLILPPGVRPDPPHNEEAEQVILGALLNNNRCFQHLTGLQAEHFFDPINARIFKIATEMIQAGQLASPITLKNRFEQDGEIAEVGGTPYLARLAAAVLSVHNIGDYAGVVMDTCSRRHMMVIAEEMLHKAADMSAGLQTDRLTSEMVARLLDVQSKRADSAMVSGVDLFDEVMQLMVSGGEARYSTGIPPLDAAMGGGLREARFYGIKARYKSGKTTMLSTISYNLATAPKPTPHLVISLEGKRVSIMQTMVARAIACNADDVMNASVNPRLIERANLFREYLKKSGLSYIKAGRMNKDQLRATMAGYGMSGQGKGIILDYIQLVGGNDGRRSTADHYDDVAQTIAEACSEYKLWCLTAAQENREGLLRGGDGMLNACDQAYALGRTEMPEGEPDLAWMELMASRYNRGMHVGTEDNPRLIVRKDIGPYFDELR